MKIETENASTDFYAEDASALAVEYCGVGLQIAHPFEEIRFFWIRCQTYKRMSQACPHVPFLPFYILPIFFISSISISPVLPTPSIVSITLPLWFNEQTFGTT